MADPLRGVHRADSGAIEERRRMRVGIVDRPDEPGMNHFTFERWLVEEGQYGGRYGFKFTDHDLRDIVFVLEQRTAMSKRCQEESGEHTCGLWPFHVDLLDTIPHLCRACTYTWPDKPEAADPDEHEVIIVA
jgi:hypothetical protein